MARSPVFALAESKLSRAKAEMTRLGDYLEAYDRSDLRNAWSRTATIAYAIHGVYNGMEDVMTDIARMIDAAVPQGPTSHQTLLDQMRVGLEGIRPPLLDEALYTDLIELKAFRHVVRHQYGIDLKAAKVEANLRLAGNVVERFDRAVAQLNRALDQTPS